MSETGATAQRIAALSPERRALLEARLRDRGESLPRTPLTRHRGRRRYPLSRAQEPLWVHHRLEPGSGAYNISAPERLRGQLAPASLEGALGRLMRRHETLRTVVREAEGRAEQVVLEPEPVRLPLVDLQGLPPGAREPLARDLADREAYRPFDLGRGPLLRLCLLRLERADHALLLTIHHVISDAWSIGVLRRELSALYEAERTGGTGVLPELPVQFGDFVLWQRSRLESGELDGELAYWRRRLAGAPGLLELPTDRPRPAVMAYDGAERIGELPPALARTLRAYCRREGVTLFTVTLAGFLALLHRQSGQTDLVVGVPLVGRDRGEVGSLIGFFINTLAVRADASGDPRFGRFLDRVREGVLGDFTHRELPFERLIEELRPRRSASYTPMFQVLFQVLKTGSGAAGEEAAGDAAREAGGGDGGLDGHRMGHRVQRATFDLELALTDGDGGLGDQWIYRTDLFDATTVARLAGHLRQLLGAALQHTDRPLSRLPLLSAAERHQLLREWNDTDTSYGAAASLHGLVGARLRRTPESTALVASGGRWLSARELTVRAARVARRLRGLGVGPDVPVALCAERSPELIVGLLAILEAGGAFMPLDLSYPPTRLAYMLEDALGGSPAPVLLTGDGFASRLPPGPPGLHRVELDADLGGEDGASGDEPADASTPENLAYVLYTSGSTGRPKGVMVSHRAIVNRLVWMQAAYRLGPGDRVLQKTPTSFDVSVWELFGPPAAGALMVLAAPEGHQDAAYLARKMARERVTVVHFVPSMLSAFLELQSLPDLGCLQLVVASGEALTPELERRFAKRLASRLDNLYGPTEAAVEVTAQPAAAGGPTRATVPIGRPISNLRIRLLDRHLRPVPIGVPGEILIGGAGLGRGYLARPGRTAASFVPDPEAGRQDEAGARLYRTGDLGLLLPQGAVEFLGRLDHQVKLRGMRVELGEVEAALRRRPAVAEAVAVLREDRPGDPQLVAYVVSVPGERAGADNLRRELARELPGHMVPGSLVVLEELPLTPSGKVERKALPAPSRGRSGSRRAYAPPRTPTEELLTALWAEVLDRDLVGVEDDFFELGGHSLLATRLVFRLGDSLGVEVPLRTLFEATTVAALAREISRLRSGDEGPGVEALPSLEPDVEGRHLPFPLTDVQAAYWVGRSGALELGNVATHVYLEEDADDLDLGEFTAAWRYLVERHGMLRAVVGSDGRQRVLPRVPPYRVCLVDLQGLASEGAGRAREVVRGRMSHQVLPADRWPLFEIRATRTGGDLTRLHLSLDLLIADAWSLQILARELVTLLQQPGRELPPLDVTFRDYVLAETRLKETGFYRRSRRYWLERLEELPAAPELPLARDPASVRQPRFRRRRAWLSRGAWRRLRHRASRSGVTPSGVVLAAYARVLAAWSKNPSLTINLTLFNRMPLHPQVDELMGDFTTVTLLGAERPAEGPFAEAARRLQGRLWEDLDHRWMSGVEVMRELARRRGGRGAVMPVVFTSVLNLATPEDQGFGDLAAEDEDLGEEAVRLEGGGQDGTYSISQTPQVWLDNQVGEVGGALRFTWDAVEELFPEGLLDDLFAAFAGLLKALSESEEAWTAESPPPLPARQLAARTAANATEAPLPQGLLHAPCARQALERPEAEALITSGRTVTRGELHRAALRLGSRLRAAGARPETLVAVVMEKGWEQVAAALGALEAGAAYLPLDPGLPRERLHRLLERGGVELALTQPRWYRELEWPPGVRAIAVSEEDLAPGEVAGLEPVQGPGELAYVIFTSGSTGEPKGVMIEHRGARNTVEDVNRRFGIGPEDRVLSLSSMSFDLSVYDLFGLLGGGGAVVLPEPQAGRDPSRWLELVREQRVTVWNTVPALMEMLVGHAEGLDPRPELGLRLVMLSGDWIPVDLPDRIRALAPEARVVSFGGATEASIWSILYPVAGVDPGWSSIPYGRPMANQTFQVLAGGVRPRPVWVPGDLYVGGDGLARGYWRDPVRTAASFRPDPATGERLYRTGDLGRYLPGGDIEFLGREDSQVKIQGYRVELGEVEAALVRHPEVRTAAAAAVGDPRGSRRLVAYVVLDADGRGRGGSGSDGAAGKAAAAGAAAPALVLPTPAPDRPAEPEPLPVDLASAAERVAFKVGRPGVRRDLGGHPYLPLPGPAEEPAALVPYLERRSCRELSEAPVTREALAHLLAALRQIEDATNGLPRHRYPSAGALYPVQTYLQVRPGRVLGVEGGLYYYHPAGHRLVRLADVPGPQASELHAAVNREVAAAAAFTLLLVGEPAAIAPLYGESASDFCILEAGYMGQLLMQEAPAAGLGLCPVGAMRFSRLRRLLGLGPRQPFLHAFLGGAVEPEGGSPGTQDSSASGAPDGVAPAADSGDAEWEPRPETVASSELPARLDGEVERLTFKLGRPGTRRDLEGLAAVALASDLEGEALEELFAHRRSHRTFSAQTVPFAALVGLLGALLPVDLPGRALPKLRYPSAGSLYPVQTYLHARPGRIEGVPAGLYYLDPDRRRLVQMRGGLALDRSLHQPENREIYDGAAFSLFLVGRLGAVTPLYGSRARTLSLLEAGYVGQLLMTEAPGHDLCLCPIGSLRFEALRDAFAAAEDDVLLHSFIGGRLPTDVASGPAGSTPAAAAEPAAGERAGEIRSFLEGVLPAYMVPSQVVVLPALPLTANGKVDRKALPAPESVVGGARPPGPATPPESEGEAIVAAALAGILEREEVGIEDNFFELGATSLHAVLLHRELRKALGREFPVAEIFNRPTARGLAGYLFGEGDSGAFEERRAHQADELAAGRERRRLLRERRRGGGKRPDGGRQEP